MALTIAACRSSNAQTISRVGLVIAAVGRQLYPSISHTTVTHNGNPCIILRYKEPQRVHLYVEVLALYDAH